MNKKLINFVIPALLVFSTQSFADVAPSTFQNCDATMKDAMVKKIQYENAVLKSAVDTSASVLGDLADSFGNTASCVSNVLKTSGSFGINVPGLDEIKNAAISQIDSAIANQCNSIVNTAKSTVNSKLSQYSFSGNLSQYGFGNIGGSISPSIR